ncbi:MAG: NADH-quinone oxidoreductase subunit NuoH [Chloroflexi bacterium]|jgi:NADH-quinone oxidoreductase subunit H|nr:MAG: NADH-quinone oxidoreductase subunit H [Chloroflexi bacterium OLB13]MBC6954844.1 NADH-quinone oxidoreductase subunit NuoH [Chloroflexota bacterium]MBV6437129.1 NAD(P)H-quinone oxidoreductase subunit 1, chloroplastic [Anaerolineae bacterium]MDL1915492.1 NADH-quinone oxidoreductase subunit NuoH [Anaerolineae bacterium CFX4]OQY86245.1 MAG: NADH-quinone oxidoreductase subunit H [Anaerolineae bacterium UTCFX5]
MDCINNLSLCLRHSGVDAGLAEFVSIFLGVVLVATFPLLVTILLIWVERKFAARIQDRIGPNRVGPFGLLQPLADVVKLLTKENITPTGADRPIYNLAPPFMVAAVLLIWAVIPLSPIHYGVDLEIGALYFVAVASIGTLSVLMAGWASNNKYALLGAFRVVALLISYEVPLALALIVPVMLANSMSMVGITEAQWGMWFVFMAPIAAFLFFIGSQAETGRAPFDLIEAESELTAGFNTEYSGMKFAMFFAGEFMHVFTNGVLMAVLFTGGWIGPFVGELPLIGLVWLMAKASVWYIIALWVRNTLPRLRIDQVMLFNWQFLVPLSIVNLLVTAFLLQVIKMAGLTPADPGNFVQNIPQTLVLLVGNLVEFGGVLIMLRNRGRRERIADAAKGLSAPVHAVGD